MAKIKTPEEIITLREGGKRLARIMDALASEVRPGLSIRELDALTEKLIREGGDEPAFLGYQPAGADRPFPASLCVSINEEAVHGIPTGSTRVLHEGDIVSLDAGLTHKGLITDMCITVGVGHIDEKSQRLMKETKKALMAGISACHTGARLGDIGAAIEESLGGTGFSVVEDLGGHGVGHKVHEPPHIFHIGEKGTGPLLETGMVVTIEPTVSEGDTTIILADDGYTYRTTDGSRTVQFEHTIVITDEGSEILTLP